MKKFFYILAISIVFSVSITSCTKEEVKPADQPTTTTVSIRE
jgi:hypothetical protein